MFLGPMTPYVNLKLGDLVFSNVMIQNGHKPECTVERQI